MRIDGFDWNDGNWPKCGKHGVSGAEIEERFHCIVGLDIPGEAGPWMSCVVPQSG